MEEEKKFDNRLKGIAKTLRNRATRLGRKGQPEAPGQSLNASDEQVENPTNTPSAVDANAGTVTDQTPSTDSLHQRVLLRAELFRAAHVGRLFLKDPIGHPAVPTKAKSTETKPVAAAQQIEKATSEQGNKLENGGTLKDIQENIPISELDDTSRTSKTSQNNAKCEADNVLLDIHAEILRNSTADDLDDNATVIIKRQDCEDEKSLADINVDDALQTEHEESELSGEVGDLETDLFFEDAAEDDVPFSERLDCLDIGIGSGKSPNNVIAAETTPKTEKPIPDAEPLAKSQYDTINKLQEQVERLKVAVGRRDEEISRISLERDEAKAAKETAADHRQCAERSERQAALLKKLEAQHTKYINIQTKKIGDLSAALDQERQQAADQQSRLAQMNKRLLNEKADAVGACQQQGHQARGLIDQITQTNSQLVNETAALAQMLEQKRQQVGLISESLNQQQVYNDFGSELNAGLTRENAALQLNLTNAMHDIDALREERTTLQSNQSDAMRTINLMRTEGAALLAANAELAAQREADVQTIAQLEQWKAHMDTAYQVLLTNATALEEKHQILQADSWRVAQNHDYLLKQSLVFQADNETLRAYLAKQWCQQGPDNAQPQPAVGAEEPSVVAPPQTEDLNQPITDRLVEEVSDVEQAAGFAGAAVEAHETSGEQSDFSGGFQVPEGSESSDPAVGSDGFEILDPMDIDG